MMRSPQRQKQRLTLRVPVLIAAMMLVGTSANAAGSKPVSFPVSFVAPQTVSKESRKTLETLVQKHADEMYGHLQLKIDEVDQACQLTDSQRAKLELAAKGAVQDSLEEWLAPILSQFASGTQQERQALEQRLGGPAAGQQVNGGFIVVQQPARANAIFFGGLFGGGKRKAPPNLKLSDTKVANHDLFVGTLESTLTKAQKEKRQQASAETAKRVGPRVDQLLTHISKRLVLDSDQQEQIKAMVLNLNQRHVTNWLERRSSLPLSEVADHTLRSLPIADMNRVLNEKQFDLWMRDTVIEETVRAAIPDVEPVEVIEAGVIEVEVIQE